MRRGTALCGEPCDSEHVEVQTESEPVKRALASLTELQRQAVALASFGGTSSAEIAA